MTGKRKRIKRPLTVFDKVTAKMFDGHKCYFSNVSEDFDDPEEYCAKGILRLSFGEFPYSYEKEDGEMSTSGVLYCLPEAWTATETKQINPEFMADVFINQIEHFVCGEDNLMGGCEFERYANEVIEHMKRKVKEIAE